MTIGDKIRQLRLQNNMSLRGLAEQANMYFPMIYNYEINKYMPGTMALKRIAQALGVSLAEFDECDITAERH